MNKAGIQVKVTVAKLLEHMGDKAMQGWPPDCYGIFYQPKRPYAKRCHGLDIEENRFGKCHRDHHRKSNHSNP